MNKPLRFALLLGLLLGITGFAAQPIGLSGVGAARFSSAASITPAWSITAGSTKVAAVSNTGVLVDMNGQTAFYTSASATPVWQAPPAISFQSRVDAGADTLAVLRFEMACPTCDRIPTLRRYTPASGEPMWSFAFPFKVQSTASGLHVSRDGLTIVAWVFDYQRLRTVVNTFTSAGAPRSSALVQTYGEPRMSALSADGSTALIVSALKRVKLSTASGTLLEDWNSATVGTACAISDNGMVYAIARASRYVDLWTNSTQSAVDAGLDTVKCVAVKLGTQTVIGWTDGTIQIGQTVVAAPAPMLDLEVSPDGNTIACVAGGLTVFEKSGASWAQTFQRNIPGTGDVDLSNEVIVTVAGPRLDVFKRGGVPPPPGPTEYRATIPAPAAVGSIHDAIAFPAGSGPPIKVRVQ